MADAFGIDLKYGGGDLEKRDMLASCAEDAHRLDSLKANLARAEADPSRVELWELRHFIEQDDKAYRTTMSSIIQDLERRS